MNVTILPASTAIPIIPDKFAAVKHGRRSEAVVLGNGPSLRGFDFGRLSRFDVFGMNAAYRYWYEIGWFPQYYVVSGSCRRRIAPGCNYRFDQETLIS